MEKLSAVVVGAVLLFGLTACNMKDNMRPPKAERAMSIAGMPVYEKDYKLSQELALNQSAVQHE